MASDNRKTHESTLEQPNRMTDIVPHKPTQSCLYEALREADGARGFMVKRIGLGRHAGGYPR